MKRCCRCNTLKKRTEFYKCNKAKDKLQSSCRDCKKSFTASRNNPVTVEYKVCNSCNIKKHKSNFRRNKSSSDGLRHECKDCKYLCDKKYREANFETIAESKKRYNIENRELLNTKRREHYHANLEKCRARSNFYMQARRDSQPSWALNYKLEWAMIYAYRKYKEDITGIKHHIDHIVPIVNDDVCGLSVPWNYQILTEEENVRKSNKFDGTYNNNSWR